MTTFSFLSFFAFLSSFSFGFGFGFSLTSTMSMTSTWYSAFSMYSNPLLSTAKCAFILPTVSYFFTASGTPVIVKSATLSAVIPGGNGPALVLWCTVNVTSSVAFGTDKMRRTGNRLYSGSNGLCSGLVGSWRSTCIAYGAASAAPNFLIRNVVDMFAANSPAPMATASSASRWRSKFRPPSVFETAVFTPGTRVAPPMASTTSTSLSVKLKSGRRSTIA
mmetsp:Transcript_4111/g.14403  ORF Transcript_4111/g.14403 Transcript_4111/m.14403 type:complete len:220 (+) Transcript_4111:937-1596(+)